MQAAGTLELVAEVAVAFAGFSGIVGVYRARTDPELDPRPDLRLLVEYSVFLLVAALFPLFLWHGGLQEEAAWRGASLGIALLNAGYYFRRATQIIASASQRGEANAMRAFIAFDWLLLCLLLANATDILPWAPIIPYLMHLAYQLAGTALTFVRFVTPLWKPAA